jgi:uncharacterized protein
MTSASYWVKHLGLLPHPEGGFYKEMYRSDESIVQSALPSRFSGSRSFSTAIYFLMTSDHFSAFHRIASDEVWHFYDGDGLSVYCISPDGTLTELKLGRHIERGETLQAVVKAGDWFASRVNTNSGYALVGCTVAPGFDFADFELAKRERLCTAFPQHKALIERLTRV